MDVKKILLLFYIVVPAIFFSLPIIFIYFNGEFTAHFYGTFHADYLISFEILFGHFILGLFIIFSLYKTNYRVNIIYKNYFLELFILFIFIILLFIKSNFIAMLTGSLFIVMVSNIKLSKITLLLLLLLSILDLVINQERIYVVMMLLLIFYKTLTNSSYIKIFVLSFIGIFILVFVLQPLKYEELPLSNIGDMSEIFDLVLHHLFPIYYTAFLAQTMDFSATSLIVEFIPLAKSLSGSVGIVEQLALEGLPLKLIQNGARLGSNSTMYFSFFGFFLLSIMIMIIKLDLNLFKSKILTNSILLYLILEGPYFIRRSFASYIIDIILITFWVLVISGIIIILKNRNRIYEK